MCIFLSSFFSPNRPHATLVVLFTYFIRRLFHAFLAFFHTECTLFLVVCDILHTVSIASYHALIHLTLVSKDLGLAIDDVTRTCLPHNHAYTHAKQKRSSYHDGAIEVTAFTRTNGYIRATDVRIKDRFNRRSIAGISAIAYAHLSPDIENSDQIVRKSGTPFRGLVKCVFVRWKEDVNRDTPTYDLLGIETLDETMVSR